MNQYEHSRSPWVDPVRRRLASIGYMRFAKGHGTENDFVILLDPDGTDGLTAGLAARLCDRRAGIGADGVLRAVRTQAMDWPDGQVPGAQWFMDYRNADGGAAEMCGNGIRVFAAYLAAHGLAGGSQFTVATRSGPRQVRLEADGNVTVGMGPVTVLGPGQAVVDGQVFEGLRVSVGNPHLACVVEGPLGGFRLSEPPVLDSGQFPDGGNVELVQVTGQATAAMRVHERGCGETRSCGTGAVAAAVAARATGQDGQTWRLTLPGGELSVTLAGTTAWLTGPAVIVAEGELNPGWLGIGEPVSRR